MRFLGSAFNRLLLRLVLGGAKALASEVDTPKGLNGLSSRVLGVLGPAVERTERHNLRREV